MFDAIKKRIFFFAIDSLAEFVQEHGAEMAARGAAWLKSLIDSVDAEEKVFAAPAPIEGCEDFCQAKTVQLSEMLDAA